MVGFWQERRVFVTGHTGFKGSWLALWLAARGAIVRGYALAPDTQPNLFDSALVSDSLEQDVRGDIRDLPKLQTALAEFAPDVVFHLAAQPLVRRSYTDPLGTYAVNVMGTAHVLEAVRNTPSVRSVVCITTDKCYQNREWIWPYRETDPLGGHDPYSSSKACSEIVTAAYRSSYFSASATNPNPVGVATARAGNVIGGGDWSEDRLIPDLIRAFREGTPAQIRHPRAIRPWQHVLEPLSGYMLLAEALFRDPKAYSTSYNFGPADEDAWPVERVADKLVALWGHGASWVRHEEASVHEAHLLRLDASKARAELHWRPQLHLQDALELTAQWYMNWASGANMQAETSAQIARYDALLASQ